MVTIGAEAQCCKTVFGCISDRQLNRSIDEESNRNLDPTPQWIVAHVLTSSDLCHLPITYANSLDPDQDRQGKKLILKKSRPKQKHENYPADKALRTHQITHKHPHNSAENHADTQSDIHTDIQTDTYTFMQRIVQTDTLTDRPIHTNAENHADTKTSAMPFCSTEVV